MEAYRKLSALIEDHIDSEKCKDILKEINALKEDLNSAVISLWLKLELRENLDKLKTKVDSFEKQQNNAFLCNLEK